MNYFSDSTARRPAGKGFIAARRGRGVKAKFASECPSCGAPIKQGKEIVKDAATDKWVHKHCASEDLELP